MLAKDRKKVRYFMGMYARWNELKNTPNKTELQIAEMEMLDLLIRNVK